MRPFFRKLPPIVEVSKEDHDGYHVVVRGKVLASSWCHDCHAGTCDCLLTMAARARHLGVGANVQGPLGRDLIKRSAA